MPTLKKIGSGIAVIILAVGTYWILSIWISRSEYAKCLERRQLAGEHTTWFSTEWEREQCDPHAVSLPR